MNKVGVIGFGEFGRFLAGLVPPAIEVLVKSSRKISAADLPANARSAEFKDIGTCDAIILAVPLAAHEATLQELKPHLKSGALIIDVCSVKSKSEAAIDKVLPDYPDVLCTHPLFGPQSAAKSTAGMSLVITRQTGDKAAAIVAFCERYLGLEVHRLSAEEHDKQMALVHALTFFTARGLLRMGVHDVELMTPSFQKILDLAALEAHHSEELFRTIQQGNPYAKEMRHKFIETLTRLQSEL